MRARRLADRFWEKVSKTSTCWLWDGYKMKNGYGLISVSRSKARLAHRVAWGISNLAAITPPNEIDHTCRNRACVRPDHLQLVPAGFNGRQGNETRAAMLKARTTCRNGHDRSTAGVYVSKRGTVTCRQCHKAAYAKCMEKKKR